MQRDFSSHEFAKKTRAFVDDIRRVLRAETARSGVSFHVAGVPILDQAINRAQKGDQYLLAYAAVLLPLLLFASYRSVADTLVPIAAAALTILYLDAVKVLLGYQFNVLSVVLTILVGVESLEDSILFVSERRAMVAAGRILDAPTLVRSIFVPSLLTSATTAAGVGSMMASGIRVLEEFGSAGAIGLGIEWLVFATVVPALYGVGAGRSVGRVREGWEAEHRALRARGDRTAPEGFDCRDTAGSPPRRS